MAILASVETAIKLFQDAEKIAVGVTSAIKSGATDLNATDLAAAQERLQAAMERAQTAHDDLNAAIDERLK